MVQKEDFDKMAESAASLPVSSKLPFSICRILDLDFDNSSAENTSNIEEKANQRFSNAPSAFVVVTANRPLKESQQTEKNSTETSSEVEQRQTDQEWITGTQTQYGVLSPDAQSSIPNLSWTVELQRRFWNDRIPHRRVGHPYQSRAPPKHKKPRTSFSKSQVTELERRFNDQKYLASTERASLAKHLQMSDAQIKTWFQNRRTKWRRQAAEEKEQERQAACKYFQNSPYLATAYSNPPSYLARPDVAI